MLDNKIEEIAPNCENEIISFISFLGKYGYGKISNKKNNLSLYNIDFNDKILKIVRAEIEFTNKCNLFCKYCYAMSNTIDDELPLSEWIEILENLYKKGLRSLLISGGEPFYRNDLMELIQYFKDKLIIEINTNGSFITEEKAKKISKCNLKRIQVSIDSLDSKYHDSLRGKGSHKLAMKAVNLLSKYNIPVQISSVRTKANYKEIEKLREYAKRINVEFQVNDIVRAGFAKNIKNWESYKIEIKKESDKEEFYTFTPICQSQVGYVSISSNGNLKPCNMRESFFYKTKNELIVEKKLKWWKYFYGNTKLGKSILNLKQHKKEKISDFLNFNEYEKVCDLQISLLASKKVGQGLKS